MEITLYKEFGVGCYRVSDGDEMSQMLLGHLNYGQMFVLEYELEQIEFLAKAHCWEIKIIENENQTN